MKPYDHRKIEKKWQTAWEKKKLFKASDSLESKKYYSLIEFPYPSGEGLHVGHPRPYIGMDVISRKRRMEGYNVLYPIGWDAFGLPTENYAIKTGIQPAIVTTKNTDNFRRQIKMLGISFDWSREINTTDPAYYKWTQSIFIELWKKGLAYKAKMAINWCPKDKIGLANEEVIDGKCERCGTPVEKREKEQWMLAITKYADRLDRDLDTVNYAERIKTQQRNWIGKSEGLVFSSPVKDSKLVLKTFSTHFEAFYADTFVVIAPDHPLLSNLVEGVSNKEEILAKARVMAQKKSEDIEGVFTGRYTLDPVGNGELPIWVASYAVADYGTGIVKCSAHDERDFAFAKKYGIRLKAVLLPKDSELRTKVEKFEICYTDMRKGFLSEPSMFTDKEAHTYRSQIADYAVKQGFATKETKYKLRDWVFSRQRYWGEPIPMIHCEKCGYVPVPEKDLPVKLPKVKKYQPTDSGESPLAVLPKWVNVKCPTCGGKAKRETDTMPNWAGSSWYYLRYTDPENKKAFADPKKLAYWTPVDWYNGGMEHTTLHLLYSRFWHKFLFDIGKVPTLEPYAKRTSHGLILAAGGAKMSKSKGNVVNPDEIVSTYGSDTLRLYEMFMGPFAEPVVWNTESIIGPRRFIERIWKLKEKMSPEAKSSSSLESILHSTIKKVSDDIESMQFNTAVSAMMICANAFEKETAITKSDYELFIKLLSPFAPHVAEELWQTLGHKKSVCFEPWPTFDQTKVKVSGAKIAVQINGKVRAELETTKTLEHEVVTEAKSMPDIQKWLQGKNIVKTIVVPGKIVNFVLS